MKIKRIVSVLLIVLSLFSVISVNAKTMYAPDGRTIDVSYESIDDWAAVGWYAYPVVKLYNPNGESKVVSKYEAYVYKFMNWYDYPVMTVYALDGREEVISKSAYDSWHAVGWYNVPVMKVYAPDGRTHIIAKSDYENWKSVGWLSSQYPPANTTSDKNTVNINGKAYYIDMPRSEMGTPDEKLQAIAGYTWYIYGTKTYKDFVAVGMYNGKAVSILSSGPAFYYNGYVAGDEFTEINSTTRNLYRDSNDNNIVHSVFVEKENFRLNRVINAETLAGESKLNFHLTNAFRVYHNKSILKWSDKAKKSSRLHSEDMATRNYFDHTNLDGLSPFDRMRNQGISYSTAGENIAAGTAMYGFSAHHGWINSSGHRNNMLNSNYANLGVGAAYSTTGLYNFYYTQNFYR